MAREDISGTGQIVEENMKVERPLFPEDADGADTFTYSDGDDDKDSPDLKLEIVDDTPEADRDKPAMVGDPDPDEDIQSEAKDYSKRAQDRINKLVYERHNERRQREKVEREIQAAADVVKRQQEQIAKLSQNLSTGENVLIANAKNRVQSEVASAKIEYESAVEAGDTKAMVAANEKLARATAEALSVEQYVPQYQHQPKPQPQPQQQAPQPQPQQQAPDPKAVAWFESNKEWYGQDRVMTGFAHGVHEELVLVEGVDAQSDEYWQKLDSKMQEKFPEKLGAKKRDASKDQVVAPATRTQKGKKSVKLTQSELRLAKRLGITSQEYAKQKVLLGE